jgi:hypothetical protein
MTSATRESVPWVTLRHELAAVDGLVCESRLKPAVVVAIEFESDAFWIVVL